MSMKAYSPSSRSVRTSVLPKRERLGQVEAMSASRAEATVLEGQVKQVTAANAWGVMTRNVQGAAEADGMLRGRNGLVVQAKLTVGAVGDVYEQEADRVASDVVDRIHSPAVETEGKQAQVQRMGEEKEELPLLQTQRERVQRQVMEEDELKMKPSLQRVGAEGGEVSDAFEGELNRARAGGQPLAPELQAKMGEAMGADFSGVRVHTDGRADALNQRVGARAFTTGQDLFFKRGEYQPESRVGQELIAHEMVHVVQQDGQLLRRGRESSEQNEWMEGGHNGLGGTGRNGTAVVLNRDRTMTALQRTVGDYRRLWEMDRTLAKDSIAKGKWKQYEKQAREFELGLGAGLFNHPKAEEGAKELLGGIQQQLGEKMKESLPKEAGREAGAVNPTHYDKVIESGNIRERMYLVYELIRSGKVAEVIATDEEIKKVGDIEERNRLVALSRLVLERRRSVQAQKRATKKAKKTMKAKTLIERGIPLSVREKEVIDETGEWVPGKEVYELTAINVDNPDTKEGIDIPIKEYEKNLLAPMLAGLSGSTDMYFNVAGKLGFDKAKKQKVRLAALAQMLSNEDHSYHEIMHEARTRGELDDYPDELPIGYATLAPLTPSEILKVAKRAEFPGDEQAAAILAKRAGAGDRTRTKEGMFDYEELLELGGAERHRNLGSKWSQILAAVGMLNRGAEEKGMEEAEKLIEIRILCDEWLKGYGYTLGYESDVESRRVKVKDADDQRAVLVLSLYRLVTGLLNVPTLRQIAEGDRWSGHLYSWGSRDKNKRIVSAGVESVIGRSGNEQGEGLYLANHPWSSFKFGAGKMGRLLMVKFKGVPKIDVTDAKLMDKTLGLWGREDAGERWRRLGLNHKRLRLRALMKYETFQGWWRLDTDEGTELRTMNLDNMPKAELTNCKVGATKELLSAIENLKTQSKEEGCKFDANQIKPKEKWKVAGESV